MQVWRISAGRAHSAPASADNFQASKSASTPLTPVLALSFSCRAMIVRRMGSGQSLSTHFFCFSSSVISLSGSLASRSTQSARAPSPSSSLSFSHQVYFPGMFFLRILSSRSPCSRVFLCFCFCEGHRTQRRAEMVSVGCFSTA